jgi:hypothetical protein
VIFSFFLGASFVLAEAFSGAINNLPFVQKKNELIVALIA